MKIEMLKGREENNYFKAKFWGNISLELDSKPVSRNTKTQKYIWDKEKWWGILFNSLL